jgi:putative tricarboxylic transport membrane protein
MLRNQRSVFIVMSLWIFSFFIIMGASSAAEVFPDHEIMIIVPHGVGGGADRQARSVQRFLYDILKVSVGVENREGAGSKIGTSYFLKQPADGYTIISFHQPSLTTMINNNPGLCTIDDFAFINVNWIDPIVLLAHKDLGWKTMDDMIQAVRKEPDKYKFAHSGVGTTGAYVGQWLVEKLGLKIRIAAYSGGGAALMSVKGRHTDMTASGVERALILKDDTVPLARFWEEPIPDWPDAPYVNEALAKYNVKMPNLASVSGFAVLKKVQQQYPERWKILVEAFKKLTTEHKGYQEFCDKASIGRLWYGPEKSYALVKEVDDVFSRKPSPK